MCMFSPLLWGFPWVPQLPPTWRKHAHQVNKWFWSEHNCECECKCFSVSSVMDWWPGRDLPVISSCATWGKFSTSGMEKQWRCWMDVWFEQKSCVDSRTLCQDAEWMKFLPHVSTTLGFVWKVKLVSLCFIKLLRLLAKYSFQSVCAGWLYLGYLWCRKKEGHFGLSFDQIWHSPVFRYYLWPL